MLLVEGHNLHWLICHEPLSTVLSPLLEWGRREDKLLANPGLDQRRLADQVLSIYPWSVFVINVKFLYWNARKRNLEIAFLRYSLDFVTTVVDITEFDCIKNHICHYTTLCEIIICDSDGVTGNNIAPIKAFLRCSRDFVTSVIVITEFDYIYIYIYKLSKYKPTVVILPYSAAVIIVILPIVLHQWHLVTCTLYRTVWLIRPKVTRDTYLHNMRAVRRMTGRNFAVRWQCWRLPYAVKLLKLMHAPVVIWMMRII
jgi:hypothetical protein